MIKKQKYFLEIIYAILNLIYLASNLYLFIQKEIIIEIFMALFFIQFLGNSFIIGFYYLHKKLKKLAKSLNFDFMTRFMEQPRMEGNYKNNWWQIHFASRAYGEYWGLPRTYIKLQYKEVKKFKNSILSKYNKYNFGNIIIDNIEHVERTYKNYLLMRVKYYVVDKNKIFELMDFLLKVAKEAEIKK